MIDTGALTEAVLVRLQEALGESELEPLVGDAEKPDGAGWLEGQPGVAAFRPYVVVVCTGAVLRYADPSDYDSGAWAVGFTLRHYGGSRAQVDHMARVCREAVPEAVGLSGRGFRVTSLEYPALGPVVRVDAVSPPSYQIFDTITLICGS